MSGNKTEINWSPTKWQSDVIRNLKPRNVVQVHRGAGKSNLAINLIKLWSIQTQESNSVSAFLAPQLGQSKRIALESLTHDISNIARVNEQTGEVQFLHNRARIYLIGLSDAERLRGIHINGYLCIDEVADVGEETFSKIILPTLTRRNGTLYCSGTPKVNDLLSKLYEAGLKDPDLYQCVKLTIEDSGIYTPEEIYRIKSDYESRGDIGSYNQEYLLQPDAVIDKFYFRHYLESAKLSGRYQENLYKPGFPVIAAMDLGADGSAVWFAQKVNGKVNLIDYYEVVGAKLDTIIQTLHTRDYNYKTVIVPFDATQTRISEGTNMLTTFRNHGLPARPVKRLPVQTGIIEATTLIRYCQFDTIQCKLGLERLTNYSAQVEKSTGMLLKKPLHDINSHGADAFRYLAISMSDLDGAGPKPISINTDFDLLG